MIDRVVEGHRLGDRETLQLFRSHDLTALGRAADRMRERLHPEPIVTYVVDRNINYTNVCISGCKFCAFYRHADAPDAYVLEREALERKLRETVALGGTQILLQGGLHPSLPLEYYEQVVRWIGRDFGLHVHGFSPPEIVHLARLNRLSVAEVIERLRAAGLATIPGGGAEILSDRIRGELGPKKCTADEWIDVMRTAHRLGMRTTATMMFGHIETFEERVEHLRRLRDLQDETGGFTAFIPWTFQPRNTALGGRAAGAHDYLKTLAIARLYLDNFANLQASWVTQGRAICQAALYFGANDVGSTMLEENVVRAAGVEYRLTRADLETIIRQTGREPRQRDCYYRLVENSAGSEKS
jgi:cyclic dehypoxanthinyl futalosine synthase